MPRCGLKAPTSSAERAFIRKRAESSEWYTITVISTHFARSRRVDTSKSRIFTSFYDPKTDYSVSMSAQRTGMYRYTQLQRTTSAFTWRSRRHM